MTPDDVDTFIRAHEDPGIGTRDIVEEFGVTKRTALKKLRELERRGRVRSKDLGGAIVWFAICPERT